MLSLSYPWVFLLLPLPWLLRPRKTLQAVAAPRLPIDHWLADLPGMSEEQPDHQQPRWLTILFLAAWLAFLLALSRPQSIGEAVSLPVSGRDLMLVVDISPSMKETDMVLHGGGVDRLTALKSVLHDFITQRTGDRLGLILFASQPYVQAPLTFDHPTVKTLLDESVLGIAGRSTAIGDALGLAIKRLRDRPQDQRTVILLTDGVSNDGEMPPEKAAELAKAAGVRVYTIGFGSDQTRTRLFGLLQSNPANPMDEKQLQTIAQTTGGHFYRARSTPELALIYESINQLEPIELEDHSYKPVTEYYPWPLAAALGFFAFGLLSQLRWALHSRAWHSPVQHNQSGSTDAHDAGGQS